MKKLLAIGTIVSLIFMLGSVTKNLNAHAATKTNPKDYRLNSTMFQAFTYEATDLKLCEKKKGMLYYGKSKMVGGKGWICTNNDSMFVYDVYKNQLVMYAGGTDWVIVEDQFPLKEGIHNESYYDEWNSKMLYYKTKIKFKKTLKTKAGVLKDVIEFDSTISNTSKIKYYNKSYIAKDRGLVKIVNYKGKTTFEVTSFIKK